MLLFTFIPFRASLFDIGLVNILHLSITGFYLFFVLYSKDNFNCWIILLKRNKLLSKNVIIRFFHVFMSRFQLCEPLRFLLSRIIVLVVVVFSPFCLPFLRKTDDENEQGTNAASIMEEGEREKGGRNIDESERRTCQGI